MYHVVFEYTDATGLYEGVRTLESYPSVYVFESRKEIDTINQKVIAEGVSKEEGLRIIKHGEEVNHLILGQESYT